ncbi:hypothetical protein MLD38_002106 [Melastoma candidum]|uniref:Uncharacterized protein n=1 Tax=Melastoma candidum TaxID=119954 RepID=A0ACB9SEU8_9MYRT|nr:hypothetical protein MLD38_002106 [Melastoma candidum]
MWWTSVIHFRIRKEGRCCLNVCLNWGGIGRVPRCNSIKVKDSMVWIEALVQFDKGKPRSAIQQVVMAEWMECTERGTLIKAHVPLRIMRLLAPIRQLCVL